MIQGAGISGFSGFSCIGRSQDLLVLYSGGLDSTLLLKLARAVYRTPIALMIFPGEPMEMFFLL